MNKNDKKPKNSNKGLVDPRQIREFEVKKETTLMEFLFYVMPNTPRKTIKSILTHHQVAVGGVPVSQYNYQLVPEDIVTVSKNRIAKHERKDLPIIYEDEDIIVINKPSGLLSVATEREKGRTAYRLVSDYVASLNPKARIYVVHRLDEDTSGVLVFAKKFEVREALQNQWQDIVETRAYYAIVEGEMEKDEAVLQDYLMQNDLHLVFVTKNKKEGKLSTTAYKVIAYKEPYSLLDVHISSGRKNQIRVQLGSRGHHVVGDDKYGEPADPLHRLGLHAYQLTFTNPLSGKRYDFVTPMPDSFKSLFFKTHAKQREEEAEKRKKTFRNDEEKHMINRRPSINGKATRKRKGDSR